MKKNVDCFVGILKCMLKDLSNNDTWLTYYRDNLYDILPQDGDTSFSEIYHGCTYYGSEARKLDLFNEVYLLGTNIKEKKRGFFIPVNYRRIYKNIFYEACINNCYEIVNFLIREGKVTKDYFKKSTAEALFERVYKKGYIGIIYLLLKAGFKVPKSIYNLSKKEQKKLPASCEVIDILISDMTKQ